MPPPGRNGVRRSGGGAKLCPSARGTGNFNFEVAAVNCYAAAMSRKTSSNSAHGFGDIIGVALLGAALLLLVAQWSFDHRDI